MKHFISLTSDFGVGTQGIGLMHAVALDICPECEVIDLRHDYGRTEIAINMGNFSEKFGTKLRDEIKIRKL